MTSITAPYLRDLQRRYDEAMERGDLAAAFDIASANREDFEWFRDFPSDWTNTQIETYRL